MDPEDILELVASGDLEADEIEDFKELSDELQEMVVNGELTLNEAIDINE